MRKGKKFDMRFRFENIWLSELDLASVVQHSWSQNPFGNLFHRLSFVTDDLVVWGRKLAIQFREEIIVARRNLNILEEKMMHVRLNF